MQTIIQVPRNASLSAQPVRRLGRISLLMLLLLTIPAGAQQLRTYHFSCRQAEFEQLIAQPEDEITISGTFAYEGRTWHDVRMRLRGEASLFYPKKSFKLNFPREDRFFDRDKMNLISEWTDRSFVREHLAYDLFHRAGLPAARTWYARLFVNERYMGLYLDVENIDEHFLAGSPLPDDASIYRADVDGAMLRQGEDRAALWNKVTNAETGFTDLNNLSEWLAVVETDSFFQQLGLYFNRENLAKAIALNALLGNVSTYYHNYLLIHEINEQGQWHYLPWDLDKTHSYWNSGYDPPYHRSGAERIGSNPLIRHSWLNRDMRALIILNINEIADSLFTESYYADAAERLRAALEEAVEADTFKRQTMQEFHDALTMLPAEVSARAEALRQSLRGRPLPFDLMPALVTPRGAYFSWQSSTQMDSGEVFYEVWVAADREFQQDRQVFGNLQDTTLLTDEINPGIWFYTVWAVNERGNRTQCLSFFKRFTIAEDAFDGFRPDTLIDARRHWRLRDGPVRVRRTLRIAGDGGELIVEPGVNIFIYPNAAILVDGIFTAIGTVRDTIHFHQHEPAQRWGALVVREGGRTQFEYCSIAGGSHFVLEDMPSAMIQAQGGSIIIKNSRISDGNAKAISGAQALLTVENTQFDGFRSGLISVQGGEVELRQNRFFRGTLHDGTLPLVELDDAEDSCVVVGNTFRGPGGGLVVNAVSGAVINANRFAYLTPAAVKLTDAGGASITNNIITRCGIGLDFAHSTASAYNNVIALGEVGIQVSSAGADSSIRVRNCVVWRNEVEINPDNANCLDVAYSCIRGDSPYPGEFNQRADARFVDQWNENYLLRLDSPLIDAGFGSDYPPLDYAGNERFDVPQIRDIGGGVVTYVDIGAFEFTESRLRVRPLPAPFSPFLLANYPNPFNTATTIHFTAPTEQPVRLAVYDLTGRLVTELTQGRLSAGEHRLTWNAGGAASGVYILHLTAGKDRKMRLMTLIR